MFNMSNDKKNPVDSGINQNDAVALFLALNEVQDKTDKNDIVTGIYSGSNVTTRKRKFFHQHMIYFVNILEIKYQTYKPN